MDMDELLRDWNDPYGARTVSDAEDLIDSLQAKVDALEADAQRLAYTEEELIAASIEIERLVNAHDKERDRSRKYQQRVEELQAKVEKLTEALKDIYKATTDLQVMSIVMANLPQPKTIPAALKQEDE